MCIVRVGRDGRVGEQPGWGQETTVACLLAAQLRSPGQEDEGRQAGQDRLLPDGQTADPNEGSYRGAVDYRQGS